MSFWFGRCQKLISKNCIIIKGNFIKEKPKNFFTQKNTYVTFSRLPDSGQKLFLFLIYLPFGLILIALRTILGILIFIIGHLLPDAQIIRNVLSKLLCFTFGIIINVVNREKKEDVEAYVSNQITIFDHLVVHSATNSVTVRFTNYFLTYANSICAYLLARCKA